MSLPFTHWQPNIFPHLSMSPYLDNLGRRPNAPLPMLNPGPYGATRPTVSNCPTTNGYGTYSNSTHRITVPPHRCPMLKGGPHNAYGTYRTPRPSVPPPGVPISHDFRSIDAIVRAFIDQPRAIMRKTNEKVS